MEEKITKIAFATDHAASQVREGLKSYITNLGYIIEDFGYSGEDTCDYPDYALKAAEAVKSGKADKAILICGTGIGMSIASNKVKGIIAATAWNEDTAKLAAQHNKANILCMGSRTATFRDLCSMSRIFLKTEFEERHNPRIQKIKDIEKNQ
jgi:ribose 5-phosphate isomerase B